LDSTAQSRGLKSKRLRRHRQDYLPIGGNSGLKYPDRRGQGCRGTVGGGGGLTKAETTGIRGAGGQE
jgi:hypothetical protein